MSCQFLCLSYIGRASTHNYNCITGKQVRNVENFAFVTIVSLFMLIVGCAGNKKYISSSGELEWIPFLWVSETISGRYLDKCAINIPVTIDELPNKFTMQFDLGAVRTVFYGNPLKPFLEKYPSLSNKLDKEKTFVSEGEEKIMFSDVNLQMGEVLFKGIDVELFDGYGQEIASDTINSGAEIHIGTIAADLFNDKILIIDYKLNRMAVTETLPGEYANASFEKIEIESGRIKIPFQINGKIEYLMFDTGSSLFSLITSKQNALAIGGAEIVDTMRLPSWGTYYDFHGLKTNTPIMFGNTNLGNPYEYYVDNPALFDSFFESENIWGITGNAFFLNNVVIIDYRNNRFGVK